MRQLFLKSFIITIALLAPVISYGDLPTGATVTSGAATLSSPNAHQLHINQSSHRAVVRWDSFNISQTNGVTFNQPSSSAATLNIVNGSTTSVLSGSLSATGSVFLVNPHGIKITPTGQINTGGAFIASTLGLNESDFMQGLYKFSGKGGMVSNAGMISAQDVILLGSTVENSGQIKTSLGRVALGSASLATLDLSGDGFLQVLAPATTEGEGALVTNSGTIKADGGLVQLSAATLRNAVRDVIYMPGDIQARGVSGKDGAIIFHGGEGGKVTVTGTVDTRADDKMSHGGFVEISGAQVDADFSQLQIGAGGHLLIDPKNIVINSTGSDPSTTYLDENSDIGNILKAGTHLTLQANNDIDWQNGFLTMNSADLAPAAGGQAGNLHLIAGRNISVTDSVISTYNGDWTLTANAPPLVDAEREDGFASISMHGTQFINNNGHLTLEILDGSGNPNRGADSIQLPEGFTGDGLTAHIDPAVFNYEYADIRLLGDIGVGGAITLSGNLRTTSQDGGEGGGGQALTLSGSSVNWTTEKSGDRLAGGLLKFVENGEITRFGRGGYGPTAPDVDAVRLQLGSNNGVTRVYGDNEPSQLEVGDSLLSIAPENTVAPVNNAVGMFGNPLVDVPPEGIPMGEILADGSIAVAGPGVAADTGNGYQLNLTATNNIAFKALTTESVEVDDGMGGTYCCGEAYRSGAAGGYWIDLTDTGPLNNRVPLEVTPRTLTASLLNPSYHYGSPGAAVLLNGLVNNDAILPTGILGGDAVTLQAVTGGFGFDPYLNVGGYTYNITGISGAKASNYHVDFSALPQGSVTITPRLLQYETTADQTIYGSTPSINSSLDAVLSGDDVTGIVGIYDALGSVVLDERTAVGNYHSMLTGLTGADSGNYALATTGHTDGVYTVLPKSITWEVEDATSVYGSGANPFGQANFTGVLSGDQVVGDVGVFNGANATVIDNRTVVGVYSQRVTQLTGADASNYVLASSGNSDGFYRVTRKPLSWAVADASSVYGSDPSPFGIASLMGVVNGDDVKGAVGAYYSSQSTSPFTLTKRTRAGDYTEKVSYLTGADASNYQLSTTGNTVGIYRINPKSITWSVRDASSTYGTLPVLGEAYFDGVLFSDQVHAAGKSVEGDNGVMLLDERLPAGSYLQKVTQLGGADASNYQLAENGHQPGQLYVGKKPLTWSVGNNSTAVYGDLPQINDYSLTGVLAGDQVNPIFSYGSQPGVGSHRVHITGFDGTAGSNYRVDVGTSGSLTITPRPITYFMSNNEIEYGSVTGKKPDVTYVFNNLAYDDTDPMPQLALHHDGNPAPWHQFLNAGDYTVSIKSLGDPNYKLAPSGHFDGSVKVLQKPLRVSVGDFTSTYGTKAVLARGVINSDDLFERDALGSGVYAETVLASGGEAPSKTLNAGTYALTTKLEGRVAANYRLDLAGSQWGNLTIKPKEITSYNFKVNSVLPDGSNKEHAAWWLTSNGGNTLIRRSLFGSIKLEPGDYLRSSFTIYDLVQGDDVQLAVSEPISIYANAQGYIPVGKFSWQVTGLKGADSLNYQLKPESMATVTFDIVPRPLRIETYICKSYDCNQPVHEITYGDSASYQIFTRVTDLLNDTEVFESSPVHVAPMLLDVPGMGLMEYLPNNLPATPGIPYKVVHEGEILTGEGKANFTVNHWENNAVLRVLQKEIDIKPLNPTVSYGAVPDIASLYSIEGLVHGDDVRLTQDGLGLLPKDDDPLSTVKGKGYDDYRAYASNQDVGEYHYSYLKSWSLEGADSANYQLNLKRDPDTGQYIKKTMPVGNITIRPFALGVEYLDKELVYGQLPTVRLHGLHPDDIGLVKPVITNRFWAVNRLPVGEERTINVHSLSGERAFNYSSYSSGKVKITPKPIEFTDVNGRRATYGNYMSVASLGVFSGDRVQVTGVRDGESVVLDVEEGNTLDKEKLSVGEYYYQLNAIQGADSFNYRLMAPSAAQAEVTKREIVYAVDPLTVQYGNFKACLNPLTCNAWRLNDGSFYRDRNGNLRQFIWQPVNRLGDAHLFNVVPGEQVEARDVKLVDFEGNVTRFEDKPVTGQYFQVVDGLKGRDADNYTLAKTGSAPGVLNVTPRWVEWGTHNAFFARDVGIVGNFEEITNSGKYGRPWTRTEGALIDDKDLEHIQPIIEAITPYDEIPLDKIESRVGFGVSGYGRLLGPGDYPLVVTGFSGEKADLYRPLPVSRLSNPEEQIGLFSVLGGSLEGLVGLSSIIDYHKSQPNSGHNNSSSDLSPVPNNIDNAVLGSAEVSDDPSEETLTDELVDALDETHKAGSENGFSEDLGNDFTGSGSAYLETLAQYGVEGVKLEAKAGAQTKIHYQLGEGYVEVKAEASAEGSLEFSYTKAEISGESGINMYAGTGIKGNIPGWGDGKAEVGGEVYAKAEASYSYGFDGDEMSFSSETKVGAGAEFSGSGTIEGEYGKANTKVTLISPGSLGGGFSGRAGFSDGSLELDLRIDIALGIIGFGFDINLSLDVKKILNAITDAGEETGKFLYDMGDCVFGDCTSREKRQTRQKINQNNNTIVNAFNATDPIKRMEYLQSSKEWNTLSFDYDEDTYGKEYKKLTSFYQHMSKATKYLDQFMKRQEDLLSSLKRDISRGQAGEGRAADIIRAMAENRQDLLVKAKEEAALAGARLAVVKGELTFVKK